MICLCVEGSHQKGMGHVFRALSLASALRLLGADCLFAVNDDEKSLEIVKSAGIPWEVADLSDRDTGWETELIRRRGVRVWVNDRLDTSELHAARIKELHIGLATFDDLGSGAGYADLHIAALPAVFKNHRLAGRRVLAGTDYLVLNPEITQYRRERDRIERIVVTLGGSDTYGMTVAAVKLLQGSGAALTAVLGPNFRHRRELDAAAGHGFVIKEAVPSLIRELAGHDLAVTGGGITPFEASALGLPCIVVANELHEIANAEYLEQLGCSVFAGHHEQLRREKFSLDLDIAAMSSRCLASIPTCGAQSIALEIKDLWQRQS